MKLRISLYGGEQIHNSLSPQINRKAFIQCGAPFEYIAVPTDDIERELETSEQLASRAGANITAPHKEAAYRWLKANGRHIDESAERCGSVNTIYRRGGQWAGASTDYAGFRDSLPDYVMRYQFAIIGNGGAGKAIAAGLQADRIAHKVFARSGGESLLDLEGYLYQGDKKTVIVNATTAANPLQKKLLGPTGWSTIIAYDLDYGERSLFLEEAYQAGHAIQDGYAMLMEQARASRHIWYDSIAFEVGV